MSSISDEQLDGLNLSELRELQTRLAERVAKLHRAEQQQAIEKARELIASFGLNERDVFGRRVPGVAVANGGSLKGRVVPPKYRDPTTGNTWTGRGKPPRWLDGKDRAQYLIAAVSEPEPAAA